MVTDEELMLEAKNGDMKCVSELFRRYNVPLYNFFYGNLRDDALSKDLVQGVFERVIKYRSKYDQKFTFKPWLYKIAWNEQNDHFRSRKISLPGSEQLSKMIPTTEEKHDDHAEAKQRLQLAISALNSDQRNLLQLTHFEGLKYAEVAEVMNCSLSAVKVRMHRLMKSLRTEFYNIQGYEN